MAQNATSFKKGDQRINRNGAPKLPPEIKDLRKLSQIEFIERFQKYCFLTLPEIREIINKKEVSALDLLFCRTLEKSISKGEYRYIKDCIDRALGKPKESVKLLGNMTNTNINYEPELTEEQKEQVNKEIEAILNVNDLES